jgi:protein-disulfide isomerase
MENKKNQLNIGLAIIVAGVVIAGAILLRGGKAPTPTPAQPGSPTAVSAPKTVSASDFTQGNPNAKVVLIEYADYQCPFCGAISGLQSNTPVIQYMQKRDSTWTPFMPGVMDNYVKKNTVEFVYRDYAFLGPESVQSAEAASCANDQGKYWDYHNYLFGHQGEENKGTFSDKNLEAFAQTLGLNTTQFNTCLESGKYAQAVADSKAEGDNAGVGASGTPKGFILKDGKVVSTIDGAEPYSSVKQKLDAALK